MRRTLNGVAGALLILAAVAGVLVSVVGIFSLSRAQARLASGFGHQVALLDQALAATDTGLQTAAASIGQTRDALASIGSTVDTSARAVDDIVPAIRTMGDVVGTELPASLGDATRSLDAFAKAAGIIDQVMGVLSAVPLLGLPDYAPEKPLGQSMRDFSASLETMPDKLAGVRQGLLQTATNLEDIRGDVSDVGRSLDALSGSLDATEAVLGRYRTIVEDLRGQVAALTAGFDGYVRTLRIILTVILAWIGIASLALLIQGWALIERARRPAIVLLPPE